MIERIDKWCARILFALWCGIVAFRNYLKMIPPSAIGVQSLYDTNANEPSFILIVAIGQEAADLHKLLETHGTFTKR